MKLFSILITLLAMSFAQADDQLVEDLKDSLQGVYRGQNCELRIDTEWYGEGYYKRITFSKNGKEVDTDTFHVGTIAAGITEEGDVLKMRIKDEIGSDGEDKYITFKMDLEETEEGPRPFNVSYRHFTHTFFGIPTGLGRMKCDDMKRVGEGDQIEL